ncbi:DUF11 domain-containing protein [Curtobacterium sp. ER1/6]|uniref:DUF11 domain-containing protein n=1 Tax=Curtobacterium sp. ER1/6 TaxID=1891920 RepID=UPI00084FA952|nr:DUF11 domain-containing protein [Curtobacterium sp. ER1/6]OEI68917.1 hypothetical protein Cus16_1407 [Curtobacterium sp. ER1/6]
MTATQHPADHRPSVRRRLAATASVLTALGVLAAPALAPASSTADTLTFPYIAEFFDADGGTLSGDATIHDKRLRLTDQVKDQAGAWSTDDTFPSDLGLQIDFDYAMYTTTPDEGADGLLMFLADGSAPQGVGAYGAALGYACRASTTTGGDVPCDLPGVPGGFAAVAIDHYGNFSKSINQSGPGARPDSVVVRGSGDGVTGYRYVTGVPAPGGTVTDGPRTRKVRVTLLPGDAGELFMSVRTETAGVMKTVLDRVPLHGDGQTPLPATLRLGFAAATGSHVDVHEIDDVRVSQPADLGVSQDMPSSGRAGEPFTYTIAARNHGANDSDPSRLEVTVPPSLTDVTWTCTAVPGSTCATSEGTGDVDTELGLPRDGSATIEVTGHLSADASGTLESTATIAPAANLADVDEADNVSVVTSTVDSTPPPTAQVETDKSVSPSTGVRPGDELEYVVTAGNRGPAPAEDVGAVDELPAALRFVGSEDDCTAEGQVVTCRSGRSLDVGEHVAFRFRAVLDEGYTGDGSDVVNVATATSPTDPDGGDPSTEVVIGVTRPGDGGGDGGGDSGDGDDDGGGDGGGDGGSGDDGGSGGAEGSGGGSGDDGGSGGAEGSGGDGHPAGTRPGRSGALAWTGSDGLGLLGGLGAVAVALGGTAWWLQRRRTRRTSSGDPAVTERWTGPAGGGS